MIFNGIYEQVINKAIDSGLQQIDRNENIVDIANIDAAEAQHILSGYIAKVVEQGLIYIRDEYKEQSKSIQIAACNEIIKKLSELTKSDDILEWKIGDEGQQLFAVVKKTEQKLKENRPITSLSISSLFTGSKLEPSMVSELKKEIATADRIDMLVSFIKWSGLRLIFDELKEFTLNHKLRIITTSYMGVTDVKALAELASLPNTSIKISYNTQRTRLHAKAYMFHRDTGYSTAYIGSSNLSSAAIGDGLEWNIKATNQDMPHIIRNMEATFDSYWHNYEFEQFTIDDLDKFKKAIQMEFSNDNANDEFIFKIEPYPFQRDILEKLQAERSIHNRYKNLVVAATGTGKTVISAFDYKNFCKLTPNQKNRLLFIAHRQEILKQNLRTFRGILRDNNFGDLLYGNKKTEQIDHLFMSIQSFNSKDFLNKVPQDFYDYIVVDEFHHAAAPSYQKLLKYFSPKVLLGLTATPERLDGHDICLEYFDGYTAAEIRLPEAINRQLLVPFQYFGVTDNTDLSSINFARGRYDETELENVYIMDDARTFNIIKAVRKYVTDMKEVIGLGFCVTVKHAEYMAKRFNEAGIPSIALHGQSSQEEREQGRTKLVSKKINFIFTVDLYNEGVDIPEINTVLFLRPTESMTVFVQQLGRGLRICDGKEVLTVLDFIGQQNKKYSFESKLRALIDKSKNSLEDEVKQGFTNLPIGCNIQIEKVAMQYILENIKSSIPNKRNLISRIQSFERESGEPLSLSAFLHKYQYKLEDIYCKSLFSRLKMDAGIIKSQEITNEDIFQKAFLRLCCIDNKDWIEFLLKALTIEKWDFNTKETNMLNMLHYSFWQKPPQSMGFSSSYGIIDFIKNNPIALQEMIEFLKIRYNDIDFIDDNLDLNFSNVLNNHCTYTRDQALAAVGYWDYHARKEMREGVLYIKDKKIHMFFINLNKSEKDFSPTTMYKDYAINETLFHWQSQSTTSITSKTGRAYINQEKNGEKIVLFVRENKNNKYGATPYTCLGTATFVRASGEKPINIVWQLEKEMPAWMYSIASQAIAV